MRPLIVTLMLGFALSMPAQSFFNSGFEDWTAYPGYFDPTGYETTNAIVSLGYPATVLNSTPHTGNYSIEMKVDTNWYGTFYCDTVTGAAETVKGFPFTSRPANLFGYHQLIMGAGATRYGKVEVALTRWNSALSSREIVAIGVFETTAITGSSWTNFSVPLTYYTASVPDTIHLVLLVEGIYNTRFLVDDLMFTGSVGLDGSVQQDAFQIYPNPVSSEFRILTQSQAPQQVRIIDPLGQMKWQGLVQGDMPVLVHELPCGLYMAESTDPASHITTSKRLEILRWPCPVFAMVVSDSWHIIC